MIAPITSRLRRHAGLASDIADRQRLVVNIAKQIAGSAQPDKRVAGQHRRIILRSSHWRTPEPRKALLLIRLP